MAVLLVGLDRVLYVINRCKVYETLYPPDLCTAKAGQNLELALSDLYLLILQFLSKAIRLYERNAASRALNAFWNPDDITDFQKSCQDLEKRVDIEVQNCERSYNKIVRVGFSQQEKALKDLLRELEELRNLKDYVGHVNTRVADISKSLNETERREILRWT